MDIESLIVALLGDHPGYLTALAVAVAAASVLDAALPQPAPGSRWLPARKLLSFLASNILHARPTGQPPLTGPLAKAAGAVLARKGFPAGGHGDGIVGADQTVHR